MCVSVLMKKWFTFLLPLFPKLYYALFLLLILRGQLLVDIQSRHSLGNYHNFMYEKQHEKKLYFTLETSHFSKLLIQFLLKGEVFYNYYFFLPNFSLKIKVN